MGFQNRVFWHLKKYLFFIYHVSCVRVYSKKIYVLMGTVYPSQYPDLMSHLNPLVHMSRNSSFSNVASRIKRIHFLVKKTSLCG